MRNYELTRARQQLRAELRRRMQEVLFQGRTEALDVETLLRHVATSPSAPANTLRRRIVMRYLAGAGVDVAQLGAAYGLDVDQARREIAEDLYADPAIAAEIERQVLARIPETDEPDRHVLPPPAFRTPGETYGRAPASTAP